MHPIEKYQRIVNRMNKPIGEHQQRKRIKRPSKQTNNWYAKNGMALSQIPEVIKDTKHKPVPLLITIDPTTIRYDKPVAPPDNEIKWWNKIDAEEKVKVKTKLKKWYLKVPDIWYCWWNEIKDLNFK